MRLYKYPQQYLLEVATQYYRAPHSSWDDLINRPCLHQYLSTQFNDWEKVPSRASQTPEAPIGQQEVWATGLSWLRSKEARMEEAKEAGGGDFYDRVYLAERPELFFKSSPHRVVGPEGILHIRRDSSWNVPEPELTPFICSQGTIEAYTIGNDMSSRDIEGENPLYLPQAKTYDASAGLGPCLYIPSEPISLESRIGMHIIRAENIVFSESILLSRMKRKLNVLAEYLYRELSFPFGCFLMSGTGIVPPNDFSLQPGDRVEIEIENIGTLGNQIGQRKNH